MFVNTKKQIERGDKIMMYKYELKKILETKLNLIVMLIGYLIIAVTTIYPIYTESEYIYSSDTTYEGMDAIHYNQEFAASQAEYLTEEYLTEVLKHLQSEKMDLKSDTGFLTARDELGNLFPYLVNSYSDINEINFLPNLLNELDLSDGARFYERRIEKIDEFLNSSFSYGDYTEKEKEYWLGKAEQVMEPFQWGDTTVTQHYRTVLGLVFYLLFALIICIAPVFASENESGAFGILLAARHGKGKMIRAKIMASLTFAFGYVGIGYLVSCLGLFAVLGTDGFDLPVQLLDNAIPYQMNMGQLLLLQLLVSFAIVFFVTVLILFFSVLTKSSLGTMAIMLFVLIGPAFLAFSKNSRLWNHLLALTTVRLIDLKECLGAFIDYRIGDAIVGLVPFSIAVHIISGLVLAVSMRRTFVGRSLQG